MADRSEYSQLDATRTKAPGGEQHSKRACILVLGMHRSGTSALTRVLSIAGAGLPKTLLPPVVGENDRGYWESLPLVEYHDKLLAELGSRWDDWRALDLSRVPIRRRDEIKAEFIDLLAAEFGDAPLIVVKDPRMCRFAWLGLEALDSAGIDARSVIAFRNPLEVAGSLKRRDSMTRGEAALLWLRHVLDAEAAKRGRTRAFVSYHNLLADWSAVSTSTLGRTQSTLPEEPARPGAGAFQPCQPSHCAVPESRCRHTIGCLQLPTLLELSCAHGAVGATSSLSAASLGRQLSATTCDSPKSCCALATKGGNVMKGKPPTRRQFMATSTAASASERGGPSNSAYGTAP